MSRVEESEPQGKDIRQVEFYEEEKRCVILVILKGLREMGSQVRRRKSETEPRRISRAEGMYLKARV